MTRELQNTEIGCVTQLLGILEQFIVGHYRDLRFAFEVHLSTFTLSVLLLDEIEK